MSHDKKQDDKGIKFVLPIALEKITMEYIKERTILEEILSLTSAKI
jgi:3-dehydroquinate synthetase